MIDSNVVLKTVMFRKYTRGLYNDDKLEDVVTGKQLSFSKHSHI